MFIDAVLTLEISDCTFIEVKTEVGIVSFYTNRATTLGGATICNSHRHAECEFIKCSSTQSSLLEINCKDAYIIRNTFSADSLAPLFRM